MAILSAQAPDMVLIPAGEFQMGGDGGKRDEKPIHTVYLDAFYIDPYEVTVGEYKRFLEDTNPRPLSDSVSRTSPTDQHPVVEVSWHDAMAYAQWAGKRLPKLTESGVSCVVDRGVSMLKACALQIALQRNLRC